MVAQRRPAYTHTQKVKLHNRKQLRGVMLAELSKRPKTYVDEIRKSERLAERARCKEKLASKAPAKRKPAKLIRTDLDELAPRRKAKEAKRGKPAAHKAPTKQTRRAKPRTQKLTTPRQGVRVRRTKAQTRQVYASAQRGLQVYKSRPAAQRHTSRLTHPRASAPRSKPISGPRKGPLTQRRDATEQEINLWYARESLKILQYYQAPNSPDYGNASLFKARQAKLDRQLKGAIIDLQHAYERAKIGA